MHQSKCFSSSVFITCILEIESHGIDVFIIIIIILVFGFFGEGGVNIYIIKIETYSQT